MSVPWLLTERRVSRQVCLADSPVSVAARDLLVPRLTVELTRDPNQSVHWLTGTSSVTRLLLPGIRRNPNHDFIDITPDIDSD